MLNDERFIEISGECGSYFMEHPETLEKVYSSIFLEIYEAIEHELLEKIYKADKGTGLAALRTMMDDAIIEQGFMNGIQRIINDSEE